MTVQTAQDTSYINNVRNAATAVIQAANASAINEAEWNTTFGGSTRLLDAGFTDNNAGLVKADIQRAKDVLTQLNAWLDEAGQNRRGYLMVVASQI
jgi:hypothetical protein